MTKTHKRLGDWSFFPVSFQEKEQALATMLEPSFRTVELRQRFKKISTTLLQLIQQQPAPCFLLPHVLDFIHAINEAKLLEDHYSLSSFEFWLNHFSGLSREENLLVRSKIAGRHIPRNEYQVFFPVGLGKTLFGSHFAAAHLSPDVDTTVASFWGWLDSFACRLSEGLHHWSLPKGLSDNHLKNFFHKAVHPSFFNILPKANPALTLSAIDLLTLKGFVKLPLDTNADTVNHGETGDLAIIVIDEEGLYQGEWRSRDAEATRQVVESYISMLRWLKHSLLVQLVEALSQESVTCDSLEKIIHDLLSTTIASCDGYRDMQDLSKKYLAEYLKKILHLEKGVSHTFQELLATTFNGVFEPTIQLLKDKCTHRRSHGDALQWLEKIITTFEKCLLEVRSQTRLLRHLLEVKNNVLRYPTTFVTMKSDIEEIRLKMDALTHITVILMEDDKLFPVGIIRATDVQKTILGSASLRDFSNLEETKAASYIDVASIIDHHKINMKTASASTLMLADAQSTNTLLGEVSLKLNQEFCHVPATETTSFYWVAKEREMLEYTSQLFAILDDTDLLNKVSKKDVITVVQLINRMKELSDVSDGTPLIAPKGFDSHAMVQAFAKKLLQDPELHSIYKQVYQHRESDVEKAIELASEKKPSAFFADTKEQNGCCRVGQTKFFPSNLDTLKAHHNAILSFWIEQNQENFAKNSNIDLYLHMLSTIQGEAEVMGKGSKWHHQDEMWLFLPDGDLPLQHLMAFLSNLNASETAITIPLHVEIRGRRAKELLPLIENNFRNAQEIKVSHEKSHESVIIVRFPAGAINSRKTQITPFLPKAIG